MDTNPHFLSGCRMVLEQICATLKSIAEPSVFFEIILSGHAGSVLVSTSSDAAHSCFPVGSRLDRPLFEHKQPCTIQAFSKNHRKFSCTLVPIEERQALHFTGQLLICIERNDPIEISTVAAWSDLICSRVRMDRNVEKALTRNEQLIRIFNTMQDGCMSTDSHGVVTFINQAGAEIFGMQTADIIGRHVVETFKFEPEILTVLKNGQGWIDREFHITLPHGRQVHLVKSAIPIFNEAREVIGVVDTFRKFNKVRRLISKISGTRGLLTFDHLIGQSDAIRSLIDLARKAAANLSTVLLQGESGTGKELFAQAIHNASNRSDGPFVVIDCSSLPRELIESELFGYVEGTFTGAYRNGRPGKFEMADGGTVFLDEIGEMPLDLQTRLLRVLQSHTVTRLGTCNPAPVDIRVIAASSKNLREEVQKRRFRQDLFYRLNIVDLTIPPLRSRKEDIPLLIRHFIAKIGRRMDAPCVAMSQQAMTLCQNYDWPGNVRELENTIERAFSLLDAGIILPEHLPEELHHHAKSRNKKAGSQRQTLADVEWQAVQDALEQTNDNRMQAARLLGISRSTLYEKIKEHQRPELL